MQMPSSESSRDNKQKPPSISVVMGVYNPRIPEQFFQAVNSIAGQTFPHWEMLDL